MRHAGKNVYRGLHVCTAMLLVALYAFAYLHFAIPGAHGSHASMCDAASADHCASPCQVSRNDSHHDTHQRLSEGQSHHGTCPLCLLVLTPALTAFPARLASVGSVASCTCAVREYQCVHARSDFSFRLRAPPVLHHI